MTNEELETLMDNEKCKSCEYFHVNQGEVSPEIKHYCFFASECLKEKTRK